MADVTCSILLAERDGFRHAEPSSRSGEWLNRTRLHASTRHALHSLTAMRGALAMLDFLATAAPAFVRWPTRRANDLPNNR